ncbi:MAG: hypothetical protein K6F26_06560 [Lachnospiraceae bacterium]|jgi:hypothetical protein|nr:hypothetical protein [Lachnospiraceae bacterium]MCR5531497.1 hypothetical protein [Lachnospiraceae bacterium]
MEGVLLIRFSIEKLNELPGPYEFQKGYLVGKAVPARLLNGMVIMEGDSPKTYRGEEYVTEIAIIGEQEILKKEIEPRILLNENISQRKAEPLVQLPGEVSGRLHVVGMIQDGEIEEKSWCSKGFKYAWN